MIDEPPDDLAAAKGVFAGIGLGLLLLVCLALSVVWFAVRDRPDEQPEGAAVQRKAVNVSFQSAAVCDPIRAGLGVNGTYAWWYTRPMSCMPDTVTMAMWSPVNSASASLLQNPNMPALTLIYNECERPDQCNTEPDAAAEFYVNVFIPRVRENVPHAQRHLIGGSIMTPDGMAWMNAFFTHILEINGGVYPAEVTGIHLHIYHQELDSWQDQVLRARAFVAMYAEPGWRVWVSESGWHDAFPAGQGADILAEQLTFWDSPAGRYFERIHLYTVWAPGDNRNLMECYGTDDAPCEPGQTPYQLTALGEMWAAWQPATWRPQLELPRQLLPVMYAG